MISWQSADYFAQENTSWSTVIISYLHSCSNKVNSYFSLVAPVPMTAIYLSMLLILDVTYTASSVGQLKNK